jgi:hypothetical protein
MEFPFFSSAKRRDDQRMPLRLFALHLLTQCNRRLLEIRNARIPASGSSVAIHDFPDGTTDPEKLASKSKLRFFPPSFLRRILDHRNVLPRLLSRFDNHPRRFILRPSHWLASSLAYLQAFLSFSMSHSSSNSISKSFVTISTSRRQGKRHDKAKPTKSWMIWKWNKYARVLHCR